MKPTSVRTLRLLAPAQSVEMLTPHPVYDYFHERSRQNNAWAVHFNHPIAKAFEERSLPFYLDGKISGKISQKDSLKLKGEPAIACGSIFEPNIQLLLENSRPSSFGLGDETVYDESVRKGRELCSDVLDVALGRYQDWYNFPLYDIRQALFPTASTIKLVFSKFAIYEPGGHFGVHRDTVRSHDHQGTLLIEVKSAHTGGDLILEHNGEELRWSLNRPRDLERKVEYIAFFTDVNHRVEPVLSGVRMVLQYDIHVFNDDPKQQSNDKGNFAVSYTYNGEKDGDDDDAQHFFDNTHQFPFSVSDALTAKLLTALGEHLTDEKRIAFPHFYLYTDAQLLPSRLKSKDYQIFSALVNHGYHVELVPVEIIATSNENGGFYDGYKIRPLSLKNEGYYFLEDGAVVFSSVNTPPLPVMYIATGYEQLAELDGRDYSEHCGNEPAPAEYRYFQSVFVVSKRPVVETKIST
jgi:hypothetical protein